MTTQRTWKRRVMSTIAAAVVVVALLGGAALADSHSVGVPAGSNRIESQRIDAPSATTPVPVRHESTSYRATSDECVGSVCAKGVTATTPEVEVSRVGGPVETPGTEVGTGAVSVEVTLTEDSVVASAHYGAIGASYEVSPYSVMPRH